jgi:plasmid stabilization system protein ParE
MAIFPERQTHAPRLLGEQDMTRQDAINFIIHGVANGGGDKLDGILVPAALAFTKRADSKAWPAVKRLREAALDHLRKRIALPLEAPRDWARTNPLKCTCADCHALGAFLVTPDQQRWHLKAAQGRRVHVEQTAKNTACDLDLTTEKRGSPHTLVAVKNQTSDPTIGVKIVGRFHYKIFYSVGADEIEILHVRHGARRPWVTDD